MFTFFVGKTLQAKWEELKQNYKNSRKNVHYKYRKILAFLDQSTASRKNILTNIPTDLIQQNHSDSSTLNPSQNRLITNDNSNNNNANNEQNNEINKNKSGKSTQASNLNSKLKPKQPQSISLIDQIEVNRNAWFNEPSQPKRRRNNETFGRFDLDEEKEMIGGKVFKQQKHLMQTASWTMKNLAHSRDQVQEACSNIINRLEGTSVAVPVELDLDLMFLYSNANIVSLAGIVGQLELKKRVNIEKIQNSNSINYSCFRCAKCLCTI